MGLFDSGQQEDKVMGSFILSEIRDLRKGMEGRDGEIRGELAGVRDTLGTLSASVSRSHHKVDDITADVAAIKTDFRLLREDVDNIKTDTHTDRIRQGHAWDGPKRILKVLGLLGTGAASLAALKAIWPSVLAFLAI